MNFVSTLGYTFVTLLDLKSYAFLIKSLTAECFREAADVGDSVGDVVSVPELRDSHRVSLLQCVRVGCESSPEATAAEKPDRHPEQRQFGGDETVHVGQGGCQDWPHALSGHHRLHPGLDPLLGDVLPHVQLPQLHIRLGTTARDQPARQLLLRQQCGQPHHIHFREQNIPRRDLQHHSVQRGQN